MQVSFKYFENDKFLIHKFTGVWSTPVYEGYLKYSQTFFDLSQVKRIFTDFSEIDMGPMFEELEYLGSLTQVLEVRSYLNVYLVTKPLVTALAHHYQEIVADNMNSYNYCSTYEGAYSLLQLSFSFTEFMERIGSLDLKFPTEN